MHEMGTVIYIIDTVNKICEENKADKVLSVTIQVGEVSGIVPSYLVDFWNWAVKKEERLSGAELKVEELKAITRCGDCGEAYETVKYAKICPYCHSENTWLETGNEYIIKEIAVADS
jgi:hydrogenase nickel incorporation protein HypA/HybF